MPTTFVTVYADWLCSRFSIYQNLVLQLDALKKAGCEKIFEDKASGGRVHQPGLQAALEFAREGDTVLVWRLDRLGRSLKHLIEMVTQLNERGIGFCSLQGRILYE